MVKIKVGLLNAKNEKIEFLLPSEFNNLKKEILKKENNFNLQEENLDTEEFGEMVYSVTDSDCKEIEIEEPTNIFYLNVFLQIIEKKEMELSSEIHTYNTNILKELISDILDMEKSSLSLKSIYHSMYPEEVVKKPKKKPMFTIEGLRARQKIIDEEYRRKKYGQKTEKISMRVTQEEKTIIEEKAKEKGYGTTAAYMLASAEKHMTVNIDTSYLRDLVIYTKEVANQIKSITEDVKRRGYTTSEDLINIENQLKSINHNIQQQKLQLKTPKITISED